MPSGRWLIARDPRDTQPQDGSHLAFNPRLPRPVFAHVASVPRLDLISGKYATQGASDSYGSSQHGSAFRCARTANAGLAYPSSVRPIPGDSWTIIALANPAAGSIQALFSQRTNAAPYSQIDLAVNIGNGFAARSGGFAAITVDNSGAANYPAAQSQSTSLVNGAMHVYGATRAGASTHPQLYYDGAAIAITTGGTPASSVQAGQLARVGNLGDYTGSDWASACDFPLVLVYDRPLSAAQMRVLGRTPWAAFADAERRIWVPSGAVPTVISATTGTGAGAGTTASVSARTIIAANAGTASGEGTVAAVAARTVIAAGVGEASGAGTAAVVAEHTTITATVGEARGEGTAAGLVERVVIQASAPGTATGEGTTAQIAEHTAIAAGVGEAQGEGTTATLTVGGKVLATVGTARGEGTTATIRTPERIAANVGEASGDGTQARIAEHTRIAAGVGVAEGQGSAAQIIMPTRIVAVAGAARGLGTTATVAEHTRIDANVGEGAGEGTAAIIDVVIPGGGGATASQIWAHMLPHGMTARQTMAALHALLDELHQVHGLRAGVPLVVSPAERRAGAVVQSISESGGVVTMERAS